MFRFGDPGGRMYASAGTSSANLLALWTSQPNSGADAVISVSAGNGRTSGSALLFAAAATNRWSNLQKTLDSQPTWGAAFAIKLPALPATGSTPVIAVLADSGTTQVDLRLNSDGSLTATRNGTSLGNTGSGTVSPGVWTHFEFKATIHPTAGTIYVAVNGVQKLSLTTQNTRNTANSSANQVTIGLGSSLGAGISGNVFFDDIIIYDGQTTDANGLADITGPIGDCGLYWIEPSGAGTTTQWTPDTGSNYARVNEATPDGDTSYVADATVGDMDTYALTDLPISVASVKSVAQLHYARKDDVGSRAIQAALRSGGGNTAHATAQSLGNSYLYYFSNWGQNPNNGAATNWTVAAINALEAGQKVNS